MRLPIGLLLFSASFAVAADDQLPQSTDPNVVIELFAEQPQLVTPTGLAIDKKGRVFVAESHTHFRPDDYDGPKADRILILKDTDGDGKADEKTVFHNGFTHIMDMTFHRDGSLYVATRKDIHRMRDTDGDGKADEVKRIINLETKGDYPHNGISGLAFHFDGRLSFGLGENLGEDYAVIGTDGKRFTGGGEGGSTYQVDADGKNLERVSTGWWNPFGMCVDAFDRVFGTDNDPGASPPCRLIQVIQGGNYGYEYRYGRSGLHPLISWTGTNPGNLPMISGTGEAPCSVLAYESNALPKKYLGRLLVASWADHRIEHYKLEQPKDQGLVSTKREILIEARGNFRPVDLAVHPDGTVYVTDWVSSSYTLHKQGRVWRIRPKDHSKIKTRRHGDTEGSLQSLHRPEREQAAREIVSKMTEKDSLKDLLAKHDDPRVRSALMQAWAANEKLKLDGLGDWLKQEPDVRLQQLGVTLLGERGLKVNFDNWAMPPAVSVKSAAIIAGSWRMNHDTANKALVDREPLLFHALVFQMKRDIGLGERADPIVSLKKVGLDAYLTAALLAERRAGKQWRHRNEGLRIALRDSSSDARFLAIKWIADEKIKEFRPDLLNLLRDPTLDYRNFRAVAAALDRLDGKKPSDHPAPEFLLDRITAPETPSTLLRLALREIDPGFKKLKLEHLHPLLRHPDLEVGLESVRTLAGTSDPERFAVLMKMADDADLPTALRATAIAGLAGGPPKTTELLLKFALGENRVLREEALRSLVGVELPQEQKEKLKAVGEERPAVRRLLTDSLKTRPDVQNLEAWQKLLKGKGDPAAGERIFFGTQVGTCAKCHQIDGRGTAVGPDLTQISRRLESQDDPDEWLLKTILRPSEDMAPQYTPWIIVTKDGETLTGLPRRKGGSREAYLGTDGKEFSVKKENIEFHKESDTSIMPKDLLQNLTDQEIRDLFAFLKQSR